MREQNLSHRSWSLLISVVSLFPLLTYFSDCRNFNISQYLFTCYCYHCHLFQLFVAFSFESRKLYLQPSASTNQHEWLAFRNSERWTWLDMYVELGNMQKYHRQYLRDTANWIWHLHVHVYKTGSIRSASFYLFQLPFYPFALDNMKSTFLPWTKVRRISAYSKSMAIVWDSFWVALFGKNKEKNKPMSTGSW